MIPARLIIPLQLMLITSSIATSTLSVTTLKTENPNTPPSSTTVSVNISAATTTAPIKTFSTAPANTTTAPKKESSPDLSLISSIRTFDFSQKIAEPVPEVVDTCSTMDMCIKGLCIKGTCMTKKCSTDIICNCDPGYTGQFCDKNITEVEKKNSVGNGKLETTTTSKTNSKHHVNGNIDPKLIKSENGNGNGDNGHYDNDNGNNRHDSSNNGNGHDKNRQSNGSDNGSNANNGENGNGHEGKESTSNKKANKNGEHGNGEHGNGAKENIGKKDNGFNKNGNINGNNKDQKSVNGDISVADGTSTSTNKGIGRSSTLPAQVGTSVKRLPDGGYVKGPEAYVPSDNSAIAFKTTQKEIRMNTSSMINQQADVVTISTVAVEKTRVGMSPEMLASIFGDTLNINTMQASMVSGQVPKQTVENPDLSQNIKAGKTKKTDTVKEVITTGNSSKSSLNTTKETQDMSILSGKPAPQLEIVSNTDIIEGQKTTISEKSGYVGIPNNTVQANPLFTNSEIKITIETSNRAKVWENKDVTQITTTNGLISKETIQPSVNQAQTKADTKNILNNQVGNITRSELSSRQTQGAKKLQNPTESVQSKGRGKKLELNKQTKLAKNSVSIGTTSKEKTPATELAGPMAVGASQHTESRKSMKSDVLNPFIQLMNIFGSEKFVENVSAVKIEIITKQNKNNTFIQTTMSKESNKQRNKTPDNKETKTNSQSESLVSKADTVSTTRPDKQNMAVTTAKP